MRKSIIILAASLVCGTAIAEAQMLDFSPAVTEITTSPGATFKLPFNLINIAQCNAFQWSIAQNDNFSVAYDDDKGAYMVDFGDRLTSSYEVHAEYAYNSKNFHVLVMNKSNKDLMSFGDGLFCTITFQVPEDLAYGNYQLDLYNPVFGWTGGNAEFEASAIKVKVQDPSGIENINADQMEGSGIMYDLTGRRVNNPTPGLYILDGRKVIVK